MSSSRNAATFKKKEVYRAWFYEQWTLQGGLITQATASKLTGLSTARISQMINEGKLSPYTFGNESPMLSLSQINTLIK